MQGKRVRLVIPEGELWKGRTFVDKQKVVVHGDYFKFHGKTGSIVCNAGNGGVWVNFDGQLPSEYVGCPVKYLEPSDGKTDVSA